MAKKRKVTALTKPAAAAAAKPGLVAHRKRRKRVVAQASKPRANPAANPPMVADLVNVLLPGFGAYAATRALSRIVYSVVQKRWPKWGRHIYAASGLLAFGGVWFLGHRVRQLARYHDGVVLGSGVAALQNVAQTYLPTKYRWLLADPRPEDVQPAAAPAFRLLSDKQGNARAPEPTSDDEFSYLDQQLAELERGAVRRSTIAAPRPSSAPVQAALNIADDGGGEIDLDLSNALGDDEDVDDLYTGPFAANN